MALAKIGPDKAFFSRYQHLWKKLASIEKILYRFEKIHFFNGIFLVPFFWAY